jgi:hemoglobin-like flavoprotein
MHRRRYHPFMGMMPFMHKGMHKMPMHFLEEIESKEDAIDHLELAIKGVEKRRKHLGKKMKKLDIVEEHIETAIKEVGKMKEFSTEELKKILKKGYKEFAKKMIDEEDF